MGDVIPFKKPRQETIRGAARSTLTEAMCGVKKPNAVVIVVLGEDGTFAFRSAFVDGVNAFDTYSRAGAVIERQRMGLLD